MFYSIIIPVYNVTKFINRGIKSLLAQSFNDYEIIMVDDGSTDGSGKLCDDLGKEYPNKIKVIHQKNTGAGGARNAGICIAKGKYLAFFDIDDEVTSNWLEKCHNYLTEYTPQILMYGFKEIFISNGKSYYRKFDFKFYKTNDSLRKDFVTKISGVRFNNGFVWNKIYDREFIVNNGFKMPDLRIQQDEVFNLKIYPKTDTLLTVPECFYTYYIYEKGNTRSYYIPERLEIFKNVRNAFLEFKEDINITDIRFEKYIYKRFYDSLMNQLLFNLYHKDYNRDSHKRRIELELIFDDDDIQESISKLKELEIVPKTFMGKRYYKTIINKDIKRFLRIHRYNLYIYFPLKRMICKVIGR